MALARPAHATAQQAFQDLHVLLPMAAVCHLVALMAHATRSPTGVSVQVVRPALHAWSRFPRAQRIATTEVCA